MVNVIDLFAGAGGLSLGFIQAGYKIIKAVEYDKDIANSYIMNHKNVEMIVDDIKNIDNSNLFKEGDAEIIIGGPPCQGFSMAGARIRNGFIDDPRNYLFKHYFNIVKTVKPKVFVIENVKGIMTMQGGKIFEEIIKIFSDPILLDGKPYKLFQKNIKAINFGIPQKRERTIIIGINSNDINFEHLWEETIKELQDTNPTFFERVSVGDAISNLPQPTLSGEIKNPIPYTNYQKYLHRKILFLENHTKTNHSKIVIDRMKKVKNGQNYTVLNEKINSIHSGSYGRLSWDEPAPTITTRFDTPAGGRFIHPVENRTLSPREAARIQSFPDNYIFYGNRTSICKQIGNAVPPKISFFLALFVNKILKNVEE